MPVLLQIHSLLKVHVPCGRSCSQAYALKKLKPALYPHHGSQFSTEGPDGATSRSQSRLDLIANAHALAVEAAFLLSKPLLSDNLY